MDFWSKLGIALAIGGIGVSIALGFAVYLWREMPRWLAFVGFGFGISMCVAALACLIFIPEIEQPEVTLDFVGEKEPGLQLHNISNVTATNIKWGVIAFDLDNLDQNKQPLPIPAGTFDFITARGTNMPISLFGRPAVAPLVQPGHRIFGSASVHCPTCKRGHTIAFYITLGTGGWYSEEKTLKDGNIIVPVNIDGIGNAAEALLTETPQSARVPIKDSQPPSFSFSR
jgi:hypothetical protein